jgi:hypothetical protein
MLYKINSIKLIIILSTQASYKIIYKFFFVASSTVTTNVIIAIFECVGI